MTAIHTPRFGIGQRVVVDGAAGRIASPPRERDGFAYAVRFADGRVARIAETRIEAAPSEPRQADEVAA